MPNNQLTDEITKLLSAKSLLSNNTLFALYKQHAAKACVQESVDFLENWIKLNELHSQLQGFIKRADELRNIYTLSDPDKKELENLTAIITVSEHSLQDLMKKIYETYIDDTQVTGEQDIKLNLQADQAARGIYKKLAAESQNKLFNFGSFETLKDIIIKLLELDNYKRFVKTLPFKEFLKKTLAEAITTEARYLTDNPRIVIKKLYETLALLNSKTDDRNTKIMNLLSSKTMKNIHSAISSLNEFIENPLEIIELKNLEHLTTSKENENEFIWSASDIQELLSLRQFKQKFVEKLYCIEDIITPHYQRIRALEKKKEFSKEMGVLILGRTLNHFLIELGIFWRQLLTSNCQNKLNNLTDVVNSLKKVFGVQDTQRILASLQKSQKALEEKLNVHLKLSGSYLTVEFEEFKTNFLRWTASCKNILDREKECQVLILSRKHRRDGSKLKNMVQAAGITENKFAKTVKNKPSSPHKVMRIDPLDLIALMNQMMNIYSAISKSRHALAPGDDLQRSVGNNNDTNVKVSTRPSLSDLTRSRSSTEFQESKMSSDNTQTLMNVTPSYMTNNTNVYDFERILTLYCTRNPLQNRRDTSGSITERKTSSTASQNTSVNSQRSLLYAHRRHSVIILDQSSSLISSEPSSQQERSGHKKSEI